MGIMLEFCGFLIEKTQRVKSYAFAWLNLLNYDTLFHHTTSKEIDLLGRVSDRGRKK